MENIGVMERLQALDNLDEDAPDVFLSQIGLLLLVSGDFLKQIPIVRILHDNAKNMNKSFIIDSGQII